MGHTLTLVKGCINKLTIMNLVNVFALCLLVVAAQAATQFTFTKYGAADNTCATVLNSTVVTSGTCYDVTTFNIGGGVVGAKVTANATDATKATVDVYTTTDCTTAAALSCPNEATNTCFLCGGFYW